MIWNPVSTLGLGALVSAGPETKMNSNDLSKDTLFNLVVKYKNIIEQQADRIAQLENKLSFYELKDLDKTK